MNGKAGFLGLRAGPVLAGALAAGALWVFGQRGVVFGPGDLRDELRGAQLLAPPGAGPWASDLVHCTP